MSDVETTTTSYRPADPTTRVMAGIVELVLFAATAGAGWLVWWAVTWDVASSPAKQVLHLRVHDDRTGARASLRRMLVRELAGKGVALGLGVGGLAMLARFDQPAGKWVAAAGLAWALMHLSAGVIDERGRGIWDSIAGTVVVIDEPIATVADSPAMPPEEARSEPGAAVHPSP